MYKTAVYTLVNGVITLFVRRCKRREYCDRELPNFMASSTTPTIIILIMYKTAVYTLVNGVITHIKNSKYKKCDITQHDIV